MFKPLAFSLSLALASAAVPAFASPAAQPQVAVRYGDLDLSQPSGARALYTRIRAAARQVCAAVEGRGAAQHAAWTTCRREALDGAIARLGNPAVARLHAAHTKRTLAAS